jgi:cellobiose phosphorylase
VKFRVEETAWDREWYRRAYFDDGTSLFDKGPIEVVAKVKKTTEFLECGDLSPLC